MRNDHPHLIISPVQVRSFRLSPEFGHVCLNDGWVMARAVYVFVYELEKDVRVAYPVVG
jgi:hypothetical protein